jgi:hypothetical protein
LLYYIHLGSKINQYSFNQSFEIVLFFLNRE